MSSTKPSQSHEAANSGNARRGRRIRRPVSQLRFLRIDADNLRSAFIAMLLLLVWNLPLGLAGIQQYQSVQLQLIIIFGPILVGAYRSFVTRQSDWVANSMLTFVAWAVIVTAVSNTFFIPQPLNGWAPGLAYVVPLLLFYMGRWLSVTVPNALDGLIWAAVIGSLFAIGDRISPISALDSFVHIADYSGASRRVVIMHNESAIAIVVAVARLLDWKGAARAIMLLLCIVVLGLNLFMLAESRLAIGAALLALGAYVLFVERGLRRITFALAGDAAALLILPVLLKVYIDHYLAVGLAQDNSLIFRNLEIEHFRKYFEQTHGFGFGLMSLSPNKPNILSNALYYDGVMYGADGYPLSLVDLRIYGALYQFGWVGLAFVLYLTARAILSLGRSAGLRAHPQAREMGALAMVIAAYMVSPLPLNWFTADNTIFLGGLIWLIVDRAQIDRREIRKRYFLRYSRAPSARQLRRRRQMGRGSPRWHAT